MAEMAVVGGHFGRTMAQQGVVALVRRDRDRALLLVQIAVFSVAANGGVGVRPQNRRGVAHHPAVATRPKSRHVTLPAAGLGECDIQRHVKEGVLIRFARAKRHLNQVIGSSGLGIHRVLPGQGACVRTATKASLPEVSVRMARGWPFRRVGCGYAL